MNATEIALLAYNAGVRDAFPLARAVAVAMAESGGDPNQLGDLALQNSTWGPSVGLWQIRSLKAEKGKGTTRDETALRNPAHNAKAMFEISGGGRNWNPWTVTHPTNLLGFARFNAALPAATAAAGVVIGGKGADAAGDAAAEALDPVTQLAATISDAAQTPAKIANWLTQPGTWKRIAIGYIGISLLLMSLITIARGPAGAVVKGAAGLVLPTGKASKIIKKVA